MKYTMVCVIDGKEITLTGCELGRVLVYMERAFNCPEQVTIISVTNEIHESGGSL